MVDQIPRDAVFLFRLANHQRGMVKSSFLIEASFIVLSSPIVDRERTDFHFPSDLMGSTSVDYEDNRVDDFDQYNVRLDDQISPLDQLFGTFSSSDEARDVKVLRPFGGEGFPLSNRLVTITHAHTFTPNLLNEFRFGYNRSKTYRLSETSYGRPRSASACARRSSPDAASSSRRSCWTSTQTSTARGSSSRFASACAARSALSPSMP